MKFASELIDLMGAFPGREFRMQQLVRYATGAKSLDRRETLAARKAVARVIEQLQQTGVVVVTPASKKGGFSRYHWTPVHAKSTL